MIQNFKSLFLLKKGNAYKAGPAPIYLRITIDGKRTEASIQRSCDPSIWNQRTGRASGRKDEVAVLNNYLDVIQGDIYILQKAYALKAANPTSAEFIASLFHKQKETQQTLLSVFNDHNIQFSKLVGKEFSAGTLKKFNTAFKHLKYFVKWKLYRPLINWTESLS